MRSLAVSCVRYWPDRGLVFECVKALTFIVVLSFSPVSL